MRSMDSRDESPFTNLSRMSADAMATAGSPGRLAQVPVAWSGGGGSGAAAAQQRLAGATSSDLLRRIQDRPRGGGVNFAARQTGEE